MPAKANPTPGKGRLKVFRTAIGFHDAYVAATSRKAALAAWGTDKDLFARGVAEEVTDPALMAEPLGSPGTVLRQLRTMPADEETNLCTGGRPKSPKRASARGSMRPLPPSPPAPRPSEQEVDEARQAVDAARKRHESEQRDLTARERELAAERRAIEARQAGEVQRLETQLEDAQQDYEAKLTAWRETKRKGQAKSSS
jgi:hypothetical protein